MDKHFILSVLSDDRPGVTRRIAESVANHRGNWLESRLAKLAGKFAGVIHIRLAADKVAELCTAMDALAEQGIKVTVEELQTAAQQEDNRTAIFSAVGPDRPGIVLEITQAFTQYNINIAELNTNCSSMPYSGEPLFEAGGVLHVPAGIDLEQLTGQLDTIADALGVDIILEEAALKA